MRHPRAGSSTNKWMRIVHNRALDLGWLLAPVLARKVWPAFRTKKGIPITLEQHRRLVAAEKDEEFARYLAKQDDKVRSSRFRKVADRQGFTEITLHGYRYAWARRAKSFGMPLREAMAHLGHGSKAVHQATRKVPKL